MLHLSDIMARRYMLVKFIKKGAFGQIFYAIDTIQRNELACKVESRKTKYPQIIREAKILQKLGRKKDVQGIPGVSFFGSQGSHNLVVMELLGPSLEDLFNKCRRRFSLKTTLMIAIQMIKRIEFVHENGIVHRDIKPDNFLIGRGNSHDVVFLIDFGLSKKFRTTTYRHIPYKTDRHLVGTARYASINNHLGIEQSRRDDLESIGYILIYFLRGNLPWMNLRAKNKQDKYKQICAKKMSTPVHVLCEGLPIQFQHFFNSVRSLGFEERPNYRYLTRLFFDLFKEKNYKFDNAWDWVIYAYLRAKKRKAEMEMKEKSNNSHNFQNKQRRNHMFGSRRSAPSYSSSYPNKVLEGSSDVNKVFRSIIKKNLNMSTGSINQRVNQMNLSPRVQELRTNAGSSSFHLPTSNEPSFFKMNSLFSQRKKKKRKRSIFDDGSNSLPKKDLYDPFAN